MMMNNMSQGLGSFNNMMPQNNMMQQNPYGQQMNPQMMGQQMQSPEMFSEQLMNPMMSQIQDPMQGLQPMAEPEGFGVYGQSLEGYAEGGEAVPRETEIMGQPHMLAYINPEEERMLYDAGGSGEPGPGGIPAFRTLGMSPGQAGAMGQGYQGGDTVGAPSGTSGFKDEKTIDRSNYNNDPVVTSLVPKIRTADLIDNSETSGIMSVVNDVKSGIKNFIEDVGMTYAGGFGSFSDLTNSDNYDAQYKKLVDAGYSELDVSDYLNNTRAGQIEIRDNTLKIGKTISAEERKAMQDEGSGTQIVDPIITGFENLSGDSFEGEGVTDLFATSNATDSNAIEVPTVFYDRVGNEHATQADADASNEQIEKALAFSLLSDSEKQFGVGYGDDYVAETITPPEVVPTEIITPPEVVPTEIITPTEVVPTEIITPPVGGNFALPGQQNFGPTPAAALNFNPNTYMQTPQNANVALSAMFQGSNPYTFEELLSQYKPAYSSFG